jgi:hypothetical protein
MRLLLLASRAEADAVWPWPSRQMWPDTGSHGRLFSVRFGGGGRRCSRSLLSCASLARKLSAASGDEDHAGRGVTGGAPLPFRTTALWLVRALPGIHGRGETGRFESSRCCDVCACVGTALGKSAVALDTASLTWSSSESAPSALRACESSSARLATRTARSSGGRAAVASGARIMRPCSSDVLAVLRAPSHALQRRRRAIVPSGRARHHPWSLRLCC